MKSDLITKTRGRNSGSAMLKLLVAVAVLLLVYAMGVQNGRGINAINPSGVTRIVITPGEDGLQPYLDFLDQARHSLYIADYSFNESRIADKLVELKKRGVDIHLCLDLSQSKSVKSEKPIIDRLVAEGIEVLVGTSCKHQIMHEKTTIIDGLLVETGSWNYTTKASLQDNVQVYFKDKAVAQKFMTDWQSIHDYMRSKSQAATVDSGDPENTDSPDATPAHRSHKRKS